MLWINGKLAPPTNFSLNFFITFYPSQSWFLWRFNYQISKWKSKKNRDMLILYIICMIFSKITIELHAFCAILFILLINYFTLQIKINLQDLTFRKWKRKKITLTKSFPFSLQGNWHSIEFLFPDLFSAMRNFFFLEFTKLF